MLAFRARYSVTSAFSLDSPSDSTTSQWPNRLAACAALNGAVDGRDDLVAVLADVPEEAPGRLGRSGELGDQVGEPGDDVHRVGVGAGGCCRSAARSAP